MAMRLKNVANNSSMSHPGLCRYSRVFCVCVLCTFLVEINSKSVYFICDIISE